MPSFSSCKPNTTITQEEREKWQCISDLYHQPALKPPPPWYPENVRLPRIKGHRMISHCLKCSQELKKNCSNPDRNDDAGLIPVEAPDGHTYRNKFCAWGNGIRPEDLRSWTFELLCPKSRNNSERIAMQECLESRSCYLKVEEYLRKTCTWYYAPAFNVTKNQTVCSPVETCPQTPVANMSASRYAELRLKCGAYMRIVYHNGSFYKNFHCALCNGVELLDLQTPPTPMQVSISIFFLSPEMTRKLYDTENRTTQTEFMFHLIGLSVSMATLLFLVAVYSCVQPLRTTPGKIILGLSCSILAYNIILMISTQFTKNAVACSITAMFLHFSTLWSFAWMSVMSFDVWQTFGRGSKLFEI